MAITTKQVSDDLVDVLIVGAGFSGLYMLHRMRGLGLSARAFDTAPDVGGTWYWNRYPGARCDVESLEYAYSFLPELETGWRWNERFATQPEILAYINHVADKLDLRRDISFNTRVKAGAWDEQAKHWIVRTDQRGVIRGRHLVMASGCLSAATKPGFPGLDRFAGEIHHTSAWPLEPVDVAGKRVGVIGTGSSGVQVIPELARQAGHLFVFQRTPNFCVPARNAPLSEERIRHWHDNFRDLRRFAREQTRTGWIADFPVKSALDATPDEREAEYGKRWAKGGANFLYAYNDIGTNMEANATAADFVRARIRETVKDANVAELLIPRGYPIGAKRICVGTGFYETFNSPNVTLVDVAGAPIEALTETGIRTAAATYDLDVIVFATGFDAMTGAMLRIDLTGANGLRLADKWTGGPANYLGVSTVGFPNFHMITGPGSPSVLSNVMTSIEQHVDWLSDLIEYMDKNAIVRIEPKLEAEQAWVQHCNAVAARSLMSRANSWYVGANVPGKPRVLMPYIGGVDAYRRRCDEVAAGGYTGFAIEQVQHGRPDSTLDVPFQRAV
jgi:cyclohexanone monooxygenase